MKTVAVLLTVYNRKDSTKKCLKSLFEDLDKHSGLSVDIWLTDDGSTDGTKEMLDSSFPDRNIHVLEGTGDLFWTAGMNNSWRAASEFLDYDGYLWLNNDVLVLPGLFEELEAAEEYSLKTYGKVGILVGSLQDFNRSKFTYGGFNYLSRISLADDYVIPDGTFRTCQGAHGNITYVSKAVFEARGMLYGKYIHGGADHDYTYLAYKVGFPLVVLKKYVGLCDNDHVGSDIQLSERTLKERLEYIKSPAGLNLRNTLLFQKRCFPFRYPFVYVFTYAKVLFPKFFYKISIILKELS